MTRDARLSALHRGDFRPGAALPSPALPPDPLSELLAARSSCLAGGVPDLASPRLRAAAAGRHSPLRLQDRLRKTPLHERGWQIIYINIVTSTIAWLHRSHIISSVLPRRDGADGDAAAPLAAGTAQTVLTLADECPQCSGRSGVSHAQNIPPTAKDARPRHARVRAWRAQERSGRERR